MSTYKYFPKQKTITNEFETEYSTIIRESDGALIPMDTANSDYAEILKQVADGDITIAEAD